MTVARQEEDLVLVLDCPVRAYLLSVVMVMVKGREVKVRREYLHHSKESGNDNRIYYFIETSIMCGCALLPHY